MFDVNFVQLCLIILDMAEEVGVILTLPFFAAHRDGKVILMEADAVGLALDFLLSYISPAFL